MTYTNITHVLQILPFPKASPMMVLLVLKTSTERSHLYFVFHLIDLRKH